MAETPAYVPLSIREAGPDVIDCWHDPRPYVEALNRAREYAQERGDTDLWNLLYVAPASERIGGPDA
jgi:hypothetical protein